MGVAVWLYMWICCVCAGCWTVLVVVCVVSYVFCGQVYVDMLCVCEKGCMIVLVLTCVCGSISAGSVLCVWSCDYVCVCVVDRVCMCVQCICSYMVSANLSL